jgi:hypothetical protein
MKARAAWLVLACALSSSVASASPIYPITMRSKLGLSQLPPCTLCHQSDLGGAGTVTTRFGRTLLANGATGTNATALLDSTLDRLDAAGTDSDGDLIPDIDELRMGSDPNDGPGPMNGEEELPIPRTGCAFSARVPATPSAGLLVLAASAVLRRRRRRRG